MTDFRYPHRVAGLRDALQKSDPPVDAALVSHLDNIRYLTGFTGSNGLALVTPSEAIFLTDGRYEIQAAREVPGFTRIIAPQTSSLQQAVAEHIHRLGLRSVGVEKTHLTVAQWEALRTAIDGPEGTGKDVQLVGQKGPVEELRMYKDADEVAALRRAVALADACFEHILGFIRVGRTEKEIAWEMEVFMRTGGAQKLSFASIVGSGPNSALIHGRPSDRKLGESGGPEFLLMDFGAELNGYCSDITRTVVVGGEPTARQREVYEGVRRSLETALDALRPGAEGKAVDSLCRESLKSVGLPEFNHGLGHSVGLVVHDGRVLSQLSDLTLSPGVVTTVEPGVYIEDFGGVRIEDIALITESGCEVLTQSPKELIVVG